MVLLHTCCADCFIQMHHVLESMDIPSSEITSYFYNPNIHPESEYRARLEALRSVSQQKHVPLIIENWSPKDYFSSIESLHTDERSDAVKRCPRCYTLRMTHLFEYARNHMYATVATTMSISEYLDREMILRIGLSLAKMFGISYVQPSANTHEHIHTCGFYKQNYCGCVFSLMQKIQEKYLSNG